MSGFEKFDEFDLIGDEHQELEQIPVSPDNVQSENEMDTNPFDQCENSEITETNQRNSPDIVQDITEESESDLQMVLNKVSETLKSLNQNVISRPEDHIEYPKDPPGAQLGHLSSDKISQRAGTMTSDVSNSKIQPSHLDSTSFISEKISCSLECGKSSEVAKEDLVSKSTEINLMEVDDELDFMENTNETTNKLEVSNLMDVDTEINSIKKLTDDSSIKDTESNDVANLEKDESNSTELSKVCERVSISDQSMSLNEILHKETLNEPPSKTFDNELGVKIVDPEVAENNENKNVLEEGSPSDESKTVKKTDDKEIFYNKECINPECESFCKEFCKAFSFILSFYQISLKSKPQYVCHDCYDNCIKKYQEYNQNLHSGQPLLLSDIPAKNQDFVEILDSDEEDCDKTIKETKTTEDESFFNPATLELIEKELDNVIGNKIEEFRVDNQLTWWKQILYHKLNKQQEDCEYISNSIGLVQKNADAMYSSLYQRSKYVIKSVMPLDLNTGKVFNIGEASQANTFAVPPVGEIERPPIIVGNEYFAVKNKVMASWLPCKVLELVGHSEKEATYKVKYLKIKVLTFKNVTAKHMAYNESPKVQLSIGTRVLALFDASTLFKNNLPNRVSEVKSAFYPGIIAEALQSYNNYRYLIFFDDGYTQYVHHRDVRLVCETSNNVWEDIHESSREFIQNYLINYKKNRPMVQVKKGQIMITELNGKWIYAKVVDVDASLIQMQFEEQKNYTEWIYRGSTRLGPLFKAIQKTDIPALTRVPRRNEPYVRYMQDDENSANRSQTPAPPVRAVAKKTTSKQPSVDESQQAESNQPIKTLNNPFIFVDDEEPKGKLVYYSAKIESNPPPKVYLQHECGRHCITRKVSVGCSYGVLSKPLLNGWQRTLIKESLKKKIIAYTAPCGRRLRDMEEVHKYLRLTKVIGLNVENFVFDPECGCLTEYQVQRCIVNKADLSDGVEPIPIQCINYYDHTMPPNCIYSAERLPTEGVNLNTEPEFLVGCDCEDDCADKSKCSCWQLTLQGAKFSNPHALPENVGYYYKRLLEPVSTGIYECNVRCKCAKTCINRVVQHPLETKLQTFKTSNRGWGLRCINDIPKGTFICIYAGELLTEQKANEASSGDEYFAELDYIEVAERLKEGYESEPEMPEETYSDDENDDYTPDDNDKEFSTKAARADQMAVTTRSNKKAIAIKSTATRQSVSNDDDEEEQERIAINFDPKTSLANVDEEGTHTSRYKSMRKLFGKNEFIYVMDAKNTGNVGRYFNHSCSPNLFVQNVFVDTHDLRFPWVAFFALSQIRAGTELTWNYNYEVGVVPGKVLYCQCGAPNCRGRLL